MAWSRALILSLALSAPFWLASRAAAGLVAPFSQSAVASLSSVVAALEAGNVGQPEVEPEVAVPPAPLELSFELSEQTPAAARRPAKRPAQPAVPSALFVSQATVLKLAQSSARPRGSFVAETGEHPAGLRLTGVAALGIGVRDGDILVNALGVTPRSAGQVIGAIIEARAKQPRYLTGTIWRQGRTFPITVEQPYLPVATRG